MRRRDLLAAAAAPLLAAAATPQLGCRRRDRRTVRAAAIPYVYMSPLYLALEQDYFTAEGLRVEIRNIRKSSDAIPLLAGGELDVGFYAMAPSIVNAIARGARMRLVAGRQFYTAKCPEDGALYGSAKAFPAGFHDVRQLKGKRVGLPNLESGSTFAMDKALQAAGLTRDDIHIVIIPDNAGATLLAGGKIDVICAVLDQVELTALRRQIAVGPAFASFLPDFMATFLTYGKRFLDDDFAGGVGFLRAYLRGTRDYANGKTPRMLAEVARRAGLDPQLASHACRSNFALDGHMDMASIQSNLDWLVEHKLTPHPLLSGQMVDRRFLDSLKAADKS